MYENTTKEKEKMRKDFGARPLTYPQPVYMIGSFDDSGNPDLMNAAWGGISDTMEISLCLDKKHKTVQNILKKGAFTVSIADEDHVRACDYVGMVSGHKEPDKFKKAGFTYTVSSKVDAPIINELPICVECRLLDYDMETEIMKGEIVNVSVDERVLDASGRVDVSKVRPITFDPFNNQYVGLGHIVGQAFKDGSKLK